MRIDVKHLGLAALALLAAAPATPAQQAPSKVAIINIQSAILATKDGEKARAAAAAEGYRLSFHSGFSSCLDTATTERLAVSRARIARETLITNVRVAETLKACT